jgi:hypothetical protein
MKLILVSLYWVSVLFGGSLVVKSAYDQVKVINAIQNEKCEIINASLPGACKTN